MLKKPVPLDAVSAVSIICLIAPLAYLLWHPNLNTRFSGPLQLMFAKVAHITSYSQHTETEKLLPNKNVLRITGDYLIDTAQNQFSSYSTTTLFNPNDSPLSFLIANIAIGSDVYVRVTNKTPRFQLSVPASGIWEHFSADAIPSAYEGIAVAGPVLDNLRLLSKKGAYLSAVQDTDITSTESSRSSSRLNEIELDTNNKITRYIFKLSRLAKTSQDMSVREIFDRIGATGMVDLWVDASSTPLLLLLTDGSTYTSTTSFSHMNEPTGIAAPTTNR